MSTLHIKAKDNAFAKVVLMPGDPQRAKWVAETFLKDIELVNDVRGILAYTGYTKNGKRISVMASGMGIPSITIYAHELYTGYGVESIIRIGTCGAYQPQINLFDVVVALGASSDSNAASQFNLNGQFSAIADFDLVKIADQKLIESKMGHHVGNMFSADIFYDPDPETYKRWARLGVLGVEMEAYGLYLKANELGKKALALCTVTDHFLKPEKATVEERLLGLSKMIERAIEVAEEVA